MPVEFGDCRFDPAAHQLTRRGKPIALSPKAYELLAMLVEKRPAAISQAELRDRLWPNTAVAYTSLPRVVTELRKALGDDHKAPRFLRTVRGFGYAFAGAGGAGGRADARCTLSWSGHEIPLADGEHFIGRGLDCLVRIASDRVSRQHARIRVEGDRATIEDLDSKNGTAVNARRLDRPRVLADGDQIAIGSAVLIFHTASAQSSTHTASR